MGLVTGGLRCRMGQGEFVCTDLRKLWELRRIAGSNRCVVCVAAHLAYRLIAVGVDVLHGPHLARKQGDQQRHCQCSGWCCAAPARAWSYCFAEFHVRRLAL